MAPLANAFLCFAQQPHSLCLPAAVCFIGFDWDGSLNTAFNCPGLAVSLPSMNYGQ